MIDEIKHHPMLYSTSRYGCWGECTCGTRLSKTWTSVMGVHYEFGQHLLAAKGD